MQVYKIGKAYCFEKRQLDEPTANQKFFVA